MNEISINARPQNAPSIFIASTSLSPMAEKIKNIIFEIFKTLKNVVTFPLRYMGSKTWSIPGVVLSFPKNIVQGRPLLNNDTGYHFETEKNLSPTELRPFLKYAAIGTASYATEQKWLEGLDGLDFYQLQPDDIDASALPPGIVLREKCLFDQETGLKIVIVKNDHELIIAFGARGSATSELQDERQGEAVKKKQIHLGVANFVGATPSIYKHASQVVELIKNSRIAEGKEIALTGQSFGGSLAEYVGLKLKIPTYCFNSFPIGVGLQADLGSEALAQADRYITHVSAEADIFSDNPWTKTIDRIVNFLGLRTPGNFGRRFSIPSAYKDYFSTHSYVLGNIMQHLDYDLRSLPNDVIKVEEMTATMLAQLDRHTLQSPEFIKKVLMRAIKSSFGNTQGLNLNYFYPINRLADKDAVALFTLLHSYNDCCQDKYGSKNRHIDYALRTVEHSILIRVSQSLEKKEEFLTIARPFLTEEQFNQFQLHLDRACGNESIVHQLAAKTEAVALTSLKNAKFLNPVDNRPIAPKIKKSVLHASLEYNRGTVGGLGVVTRSLLPKQREYGHDARVITPFFSFYHDTLNNEKIEFAAFVEHEFKGNIVKSAIYKVHNGDAKNGKKVKQYLIAPTPERGCLFDVGEVKDLYANYEHSNSIDRLLYFSSAVAAFAGTYRGKKHKKSFDVAHLHDWHAAAASLLLNTHYNPMREEIGLPPVKRIFHAHCAPQQGILSASAYKNIGLEASMFITTHADANLINIQADALNTSDAVVYVSKEAANEAMTEAQAYGWDLHTLALKRHHQGRLKGVTNGITYADYDPANTAVFGRFAMNNLDEAGPTKAAAKHFAFEQNLIADPTKPLFMFVGRYSSEKGIDMLPGLVNEIAARGGQTLIMGIETQDASTSNSISMLKKMAQDSSLNLRFLSKVQEQTAFVSDTGVQAGNLIRLATDVSLVPSHEEACGLVPMELLSVGALVLTSQVQGLKDTCKGIGEVDSNGQPYTIDNFNSFTYDNEDFFQRGKNSLQAVAQAFDFFTNTPAEEKIRVCQRIISSSKQYDWLEEGGAIQQMEAVYVEA
ncbi:MAG: glycogen/starch synthase [Candidatus Protochlamydia sp.]|nr:glycogen/starch synthase [Candidatus Protochlamydia sp.]